MNDDDNCVLYYSLISLILFFIDIIQINQFILSSKDCSFSLKCIVVRKVLPRNRSKDATKK